MTDSELDLAITVDSPFERSVDTDLLRRATEAAANQARADAVELPRKAEISLLVTDNDRIRQLNREYRGVDRPTDVLSFALSEGQELGAPPDQPYQLGDVVVSYPYAETQARELEHGVDLEVAWLVIHGALQLFGYTHDTDADAAHMEALEDRALRAMGFSRSPREPGPE